MTAGSGSGGSGRVRVVGPVHSDPGPAAPGDLPAVRRLLASSGLPADDVTEDGLGDFLVLRSGDGIVACVGLEIAGEAALLRSLAVRDDRRGEGLGVRLTAAAEALAAARGVRRLWLLTTTAAGFFGGLGYAVADRDHAPAAIRSTAQFRDLCPSSAVCMSKEPDPGGEHPTVPARNLRPGGR